MARQQKILSTEEVKKLIKAADQNIQQTSLPNQFDKMLIKTCLGHGLRNEETVTLKRKHVQFSPSKVEIERENTKSDAGVRKVPTLESIGDIDIKEDFIQYVSDNTEDPEDYLFPSSRGSGHISSKYFQENLLRRLAWETGFYPHVSEYENITKEVEERQRVRPHALRHTYGTRHYENGVPPKELQSLMGHKKVEITLNLYASLANERSRDMIDEAAKSWK